MAAVWGVAVGPLDAHDRAALVIANDDYGEHSLPQIKADAAAVTEALRREGFRTTVAENVDARGLTSAVDQFVRTTPVRGLAVVYFAGRAGRRQSYASKGAWWNHLEGAGKRSNERKSDPDAAALPEILKLLAEHSACSAHLVVIDAAPATPSQAPTAPPPGLAPVDPSDLAEDTVLVLSPANSSSNASPLAAAFAGRLASGRESIGKLTTAVQEELKLKSPEASATVVAGNRRAAEVGWGGDAGVRYRDDPAVGAGERPGQHWIGPVGTVFCWCPPGVFRMGDSASGRDEFEDAAAVEVELTRGFWIGKYEWTQIEAQRLKGSASRYSFPGKLLPHHLVQHEQAGKSIAVLNEQQRKAGRLPDDWEYALPTEAQWEYACRAGSTTRYSFGDDESDLHRHANYADRRLLADDGALQFASARFDDGVGRGLAPAGRYAPNAWGLHDMHGNVAEWCSDRYLPRLSGGRNPRVDGTNKEAAPAGVVRGGAWCSTAKSCESAFRNSEYSGGNAKSRDFIGMRLILQQK